MKASLAMQVEEAIAMALCERILKAATSELAENDLQTLRALHRRTPGEALPRALSHLVGQMDPRDPRRTSLIEEGQFAAQAARVAERRRNRTESPGGDFVLPPTPYVDVLPRTSALPLESEAKWHLPPAFSGDWVDLRSQEAEAVVDRIRSAFPSSWAQGVAEGVRAVRRMHMSCYTGFDAVEVLFRFEARAGVSQLVLLGPTFAVWLTGRTEGIHQLNARRDEDGRPYLDLSNDRKAAEYLRFFCGAAFADDGPFVVIESASDLKAHMQAGAAYDVPEDVFEMVQMERIEGQGGQPSWQAMATILYASSLFRSRFQIKSDGALEMLDDAHQVPDLPALRQVMGRGLRQVRGLATGAA